MAFRLSREAQIGLIATGAGVILFFGLNYLKGHSVFQRYNTYYAVFPSTDNLSTSDKVLYRGYKVGQVQSLSFDQQTGKIIVEFEVLRAVPVPKDSWAMITNLDLLGTKGLVVVPGSMAQLAEDGDTLRDSVATGSLEQITRSLDPLRLRLDTLLEGLNQTVRHLNALLSAQGALPTAVTSVRHLVETAQGEVAPTAAKLRQTLHQMEATLQEMRPSVTQTLRSVALMSDSFRTKLPPLMAKLDSSAAQLHTTLRLLNDSSGTAGLILRDSSLYRNLDKTAHNLALLLEDIRRRPHRFVHFSLFGRRRDE
ncbi:MAG: MlaD family protein [Bacteroidia bacterium]|nr:MlaD family protein [Bacteroidia bacterium]MDW8089625.1 MlaD family protein [Bacteroidia bacterium]